MDEWKEIARSLPIGAKRKVPCCSTDPSTYISNDHKGIALGPCFRCGHREWEPHGERSIAEILRTRQVEDTLASNKTPTMPSDSVPLPEGPKAAWQWVLLGGLKPEEAEQMGWRWHEASRRVLIPVYQHGNLVGLIGRAVHGERPKYRALGGDPNAPYMPPQRAVRARVVVEDVLSALAVWRAGINSVAVLGTSISPEQAQQIANGVDRVIGWFDGDAAGEKAWKRLRGRMALYPVELHRITTDQDPKRLHRQTLVERITPFIGE